MPVFIFLLFALSIVAIRILIYKGHKASAQLPMFQSNYFKAICENKDCLIKQECCSSSDSQHSSYILLHRLTLGKEHAEGPKCPWCSEPLSIKPLNQVEPMVEKTNPAVLQLENS